MPTPNRIILLNAIECADFMEAELRFDPVRLDNHLAGMSVGERAMFVLKKRGDGTTQVTRLETKQAAKEEIF